MRDGATVGTLRPVRLRLLARLFAACSTGSLILACAGAAPPPVAAHDVEDEHDAGAIEEAAPAETIAVDTPERSRPPSTASYEEAMSKPESLDVNDDHLHLSDIQLTNPMRGVANGCRLPSKVKVTIKTAVQLGRAIGVTVDARFIKPKSRKPSKPPTRAEAKALAKISACIDRNVRAVVWPPSRRRDSFTMEL